MLTSSQVEDEWRIGIGASVLVIDAAAGGRFADCS
jgi:hypothetical protein